MTPAPASTTPPNVTAEEENDKLKSPKGSLHVQTQTSNLKKSETLNVNFVRLLQLLGKT